MNQNQANTDRTAESQASLGLLLVGHGTRDSAGLAGFWELHRLLAELCAEHAGELPVEACFLELAEPNIKSGIEALLDRGVRQIVVAPLLLFAAGHAKRDIPQGVAAALEELWHPSHAAKASRVVQQLPPLACHEKLLELSALRYREAKPLILPAETSKFPGQNETLILIGRGSSDPEAQAEMFRFAELRASQLPGVDVQVCFYALSEPKVEPTMARVANSGTQRVVVQPHLLFAGEVRQGIERLAEKYAAPSTPRQHWWLCEPLGPHRQLAEALWELFQSESQPWHES